MGERRFYRVGRRGERGPLGGTLGGSLSLYRRVRAGDEAGEGWGCPMGLRLRSPQAPSLL